MTTLETMLLNQPLTKLKTVEIEADQLLKRICRGQRSLRAVLHNNVDRFVAKVDRRLAVDPDFLQRVIDVKKAIDLGRYGRCKTCSSSIDIPSLFSNPLETHCKSCRVVIPHDRKESLRAIIQQEIKTKKQTIEVKEKELKSIIRAEANMRQSAEDGDKSFVSPDRGVIEKQLPRWKAELEALERALIRVDQDPEFGICENCEQEIPLGRMKLVPHARTCAKCNQ